MTDELLPCPFCGSGTTIIEENKAVWGGVSKPQEPISVEVRHWCVKGEDGMASRLLAFVGRDRKSAINRWNKREQNAE